MSKHFFLFIFFMLTLQNALYADKQIYFYDHEIDSKFRYWFTALGDDDTLHLKQDDGNSSVPSNGLQSGTLYYAGKYIRFKVKKTESDELWTTFAVDIAYKKNPTDSTYKVLLGKSYFMGDSSTTRIFGFRTEPFYLRYKTIVYLPGAPYYRYEPKTELFANPSLVSNYATIENMPGFEYPVIRDDDELEPVVVPITRINDQPFQFKIKVEGYWDQWPGDDKTRGGYHLLVVEDNTAPVFKEWPDTEGEKIKVTPGDPKVILGDHTELGQILYVKSPFSAETDPVDYAVLNDASKGEGSGIRQNNYRITGPDGVTGIWTDTNIDDPENPDIFELSTQLIPPDGTNPPPGPYKVEFQAIDNVGNDSDIISKTVFLDNLAPKLVQNIRCSLKTEQSDNDCDRSDGERVVRTFDGIDVAWDEVTDDRPENGCGVARYDVAIQNVLVENQNPEHQEPIILLSDENKPITALSYSIDIGKLDRGKTYNICVRSVDKLGNASDWTFRQITIPQNPVIIDQVKYGEPRYAGSLIYPVTMTIDTQGNNKQIFLYRSSVDYSETEPLTVDNPDVVDGIITLDDEYVGNVHAHRHYVYWVCTENSGDGIDGSFLEYGNVFDPGYVPNYEGNFMVRIFRGDPSGSPISVVDRLGFGSGGVVIDTAVNEKVFFELITENPDRTDFEGDLCALSLWNLNGNQIREDLETEAIGGTSYVTLLPQYDTAYQLFASVAESLPDGRTLADYYGTDAAGTPLYMPQNTVHTVTDIDGTDRDEGFYITFDLARPDGSFLLFPTIALGQDLSALADGDALSAANPTNSLDVSVLVRAGKITDKTSGWAQSGIAKVELLNVDPGAFRDPKHVIVEDIEALIASNPGSISLDGTAFVDLGIGGPTTNPLPNADRVYAWNLGPMDAGTETGSRIVLMIITDNAGNRKYTVKNVSYDTIPPAKPAAAGFTCSVQQNEIEIVWQPVADDSLGGYRVRYIDANGEARTIITASCSVTIDTTGFGYDAAVPVTVTAFDNAKNESDSVTYTPYTLPLPGTLSSPEYGYDTANGRFIRWNIGGGIAARQVLEALDEEGNVVRSLDEGSGTFLHSGLLPHRKYTYRVRAFNSYVPNAAAGESAKSAISAVCDPFGAPFNLVNNIAPGPFALISPSGFTSATPSFRWQRSVDPDGDPVAYTIFLREEDAAEFTAIGSTVDPVRDFTPELPLEYGKQYAWKVTAGDAPDAGYEGTPYVPLARESDVRTIGIDDIGPVLEWIDLPEGAATNASEIRIRADDAESGIEHVVYRTSDSSGDTGIAIVNGIGTVVLHESNTPYTITVEAYDAADNATTIESHALAVDYTPPAASETGVSIGLEQGNACYLSGYRTIPVIITGRDNLSGIARVRYAFVDGPAASVVNWIDIDIEKALLPDGSIAYEGGLALDGVDGGYYTLVVRIEDSAGNVSDEVRTAIPVFLDASGPEASLDVGGYTVAWSRYSVADIDLLRVAVSAADVHSGANTNIAIVAEDAAAGPIEWQADWDTAKSAALAIGKKYRIVVKATNGTGLTMMVRGDVFAYDATAPIDCGLASDASREYDGHECVRVRAHAAEPDAIAPDFGIAEYRLAIGTDADATAVTRAISGNIDGWLVRRTNSADALFSFALPGIGDGMYRLSLDVVNNAGLVAHASGGYLTVRNNADRIVVRDAGPYTTDATRLSGGWTYMGTKSVSYYRYRIMSGAEPVTIWNTTPANDVLVENLTLASGTTYFIEAVAVFGDGNASDTGRSDGVLVDTTPPVTEPESGFVAPAMTTSKDLWVSWNMNDPESGIEKIEALIGKIDDEGNTVPVSNGWIPVGSTGTGCRMAISANADGDPLDVVNGDRLSLALRATNRAGLSTDTPHAFVTIVDTAPAAPLVVDQGDVINAAQYPKAQWFPGASDATGGNVRYSWTVVLLPGDFTGAVWFDDDGTMEARPETANGFPFVPTHGSTWYFAVKATNGAGLESIGMSNGITFDSTAPFIADVRLVRGADTGTDLRYVNDTNNLAVVIESHEDIDQLDTYTVTAGTWDGGGNFVSSTGNREDSGTSSPVTLVNLVEDVAGGNLVVFKGTCANEAGLSESGYSFGSVYDAGIPVVKNAIAVCHGGTISASWEVVAGKSPLGSCAYAIEPVGYAGAHAWTEIGAVTELDVDVAGADIADGHYAFFIRARNAAGTWSQVASAPKTVLVDRSPARMTSFTSDSYAADGLRFRIDAEDEISGIAEYQYRLGTAENPDALTEGWMSITTGSGSVEKSIDFSQLPGGSASVIDGSKLVLSVRVRNGASLWTAPAAGTPILVDRTAASAPDLSAPRYTVLSGSITGVTVSSTDEQSGVWKYALAVTRGASAGDIASAEWNETDVPEGSLSASHVPIEGLALEHGDDVFVCIRTKNGSGLWSSVAVAGPVSCDRTAPSLSFDGGTTETVVNDYPAEIRYTIAEDVSESVFVAFTLTSRLDGTAAIQDPVECAPGMNHFVFDREIYATYDLSYAAVDAAGNSANGTNIKSIRLNAPPEFTVRAIDTTPGRTLELSEYVWIDEREEDLPIAYSWDFTTDGSVDDTSDGPAHPYAHIGTYDQVSEYTVTLTLTDSRGKSATKTAAVTVRNTEKGELYSDEYWSGTHYIRGHITVPDGMTLTVMPGADVIVTGDPLNGYDQRLTIEGSLAAGASSQFRIESTDYGLWNGILVEGSAELVGVTVRNAKRGVTATAGAVVSIDGCTFDADGTGVHVVGNGSTVITGTRFTNNTRYGIKEDEGGRPTVTRCAFGGNLHDYYGEDLTIMTIDELNARNGNSDNERE